METELKPCPFCGTTAKKNIDGYVIKIPHKKDCYFYLVATLEDCDEITDELLCEAWNRRAYEK